MTKISRLHTNCSCFTWQCEGDVTVIHVSYLAFSTSTFPHPAGTQNKQLDEEEGHQGPETSLIIWWPH